MTTNYVAPTGNLDSKNSLEIMKIIKAISKDRLVLLVTHERPLAEFYASRIIEIRDGEVIKDYENKEVDSLDYAVDNRFYLKDFPVTQHIKEESCLIDLYKEEDSKIQLDVVVKNGNIYIKSNTKDKIEIVDENSSIEFIDEHYKKISKNDLDTYEFHFKDIIDSNFPKKYSSIFNPIRLIVNGFKKVFDFPILKKILLFGFAFSAMFIMYSISTLSASFRIKEEDFVKTNKNYLLVNTPKVTYDDYVKYSSFSSVSYLLLGDTTVSLKLAYQDFYQVNDVSGMISGSLTDASTLTSSDLILGRLPENDYEVVIDTLTIQNALKSNESLKMAWIRSEEDFLNRTLHVSHMKDFTIVGISDLKSPSIYVARSQFTNILANTSSDDSWTDESTTGMVDVALYQDQIVLKEGRMPNDYEAIVPISEKEVKPLNKVIQEEVNGKKLMVVGYYDSKEPYSFTLVNGATVTYSLFDRYTNFAVYPKDKEMALSDFQQENLNIKDSYQSDKDQYKENRKEQTKNAVFVSIVILSISLIEIYLMIRSSFLSRMKEVGILRAIGVKKMDIYKMFMGEIFAITMLASVPGLLFMAYVLSVLSSIPMMETMFVSSPFLVLFAFVFVLLFHLVVGLMPVFNTIRKTPASILSRHDLD